MRAATNLTAGGTILLVLAIALGGCGKTKQTDPRQAGDTRAQAKRQQAACASSAADRLKGLLFDQAIAAHQGDRSNLDILADYSVARLEGPVVKGWDPALDIIRCKGRFILEIPPGAERAFAGERRLQADIDYTAQAAADGNGFVYEQKGAEPVVARLASFDLTGAAYRPPPAIDEQHAGPEVATPTAVARADMPAPLPPAPPTRPPPLARQTPALSARTQTYASGAAPEPGVPDPSGPSADSSAGESGEATVRAFYAALGAGNGTTASAQIVPEKRSGRTFSPEAISRFYGRLPEPIRLTGIVPLARGGYRVSYRYSAGRSRCNGSAIVSLTNRDGRDLIRSIRALSGC